MVALTLDVSLKWVDNLLTRTVLQGVSKARQGIERRITDDGVLAIEICRLLCFDLGIPISRAAEIANAAVDIGSPHFDYVSSGGLSLRISLDTMRARLRSRLADAIQSLPRTRRGRPARHRDPDIID